MSEHIGNETWLAGKSSVTRHGDLVRWKDHPTKQKFPQAMFDDVDDRRLSPTPTFEMNRNYDEL